MEQQVVSCGGAPKPAGPYSQAIQIGQFVYASGQVGLDPSTGKMAGEDIESQTRQALKNLDAVLKAAGSSLAQVVKTTVFLTDISEFRGMNGVYADYFPQKPPARSAMQVAKLPGDAKVEIEAVAFVP